MLKPIAKIVLQSDIRRDNSSRKKRFMAWDAIEKIAILVDREDCSDKRALDKFIDDTKKYVEVFYFEPQSKEPSYSDWQCFSKKDRNLIRLPKKALVDELRAKKYDVAINTCNEDNFFSESVHNALNAPLKCASHSQFELSDLVIKKTGPDNLISYLNEVVRYLKMIKS